MDEEIPARRAEPITVLQYVGYEDDRSGIVSVVRALAAAGRFECRLGVAPGFRQQRRPPLPVLELPAMPAEEISLRAWWRARAVARDVKMWIQQGTERVYHGHSRAGLLVALWLERWGERRAVVTVHAFGRQRWFYRWAARQLAGRLFWLSPAMKRYYGVPPPGWDGCVPNALVRPPRRRREPGEGTRVRLGGAGMLVRWKGWHLVLEALAALPRDLRDRISFSHIGADDGTAESEAYARELRALAERLGVAANVTWRGWEPSSEALLTEVDALVVSSVREPFSMAALEALGAGVPVIAADDGGPGDFIEEGRSGWFFRSGDAADLSRVLARLVQTDALGQVSIDEDALRRFDHATVAEQWREIYQRRLETAAAR